MADLSAFDVFIGYIIYGLDCSIKKIFNMADIFYENT